jgi:hypothetical protein
MLAIKGKFKKISIFFSVFKGWCRRFALKVKTRVKKLFFTCFAKNFQGFDGWSVNFTIQKENQQNPIWVWLLENGDDYQLDR